MQQNVLECLALSPILHEEKGSEGKKQEECEFKIFPSISHLCADIIYSEKFIIFIDS